MRFLRNPMAIAMAALSLTLGGAALAQTTVTAQATVGTTTGGTTGSATGTTTGTAAPTAQKVPRNFATDLAKASLAKQGITNPTKAQLAAERSAITAQRAQGKGWGVIAQSLGLNLGQVISDANRAKREARKADDDRGEKGDKDKHGKKGHEQGKERGDHKESGQRPATTKSGTAKSGTTKSGTTTSGTTTSGGEHGGGAGGSHGGGGGGGGHGGK